MFVFLNSLEFLPLLDHARESSKFTSRPCFIFFQFNEFLPFLYSNNQIEVILRFKHFHQYSFQNWLLLLSSSNPGFKPWSTFPPLENLSSSGSWHSHIRYIRKSFKVLSHMIIFEGISLIHLWEFLVQGFHLLKCGSLSKLTMEISPSELVSQLGLILFFCVKVG